MARDLIDAVADAVVKLRPQLVSKVLSEDEVVNLTKAAVEAELRLVRQQTALEASLHDWRDIRALAARLGEIREELSDYEEPLTQASAYLRMLSALTPVKMDLQEAAVVVRRQMVQAAHDLMNQERHAKLAGKPWKGWRFSKKLEGILAHIIQLTLTRVVETYEDIAKENAELKFQLKQALREEKHDSTDG